MPLPLSSKTPPADKLGRIPEALCILQGALCRHRQPVPYSLGW